MDIFQVIIMTFHNGRYQRYIQQSGIVYHVWMFTFANNLVTYEWGT